MPYYWVTAQSEYSTDILFKRPADLTELYHRLLSTLGSVREVSIAANSRCLQALADVDDPTDAIATLDRITTRKQVAPKRTAKAFNPIARDETQIFRALLDGQHMIRGFSNPDIRQKPPRLASLEGHHRPAPPKRQSDAHFQSMSRSRIDRQDSALSTMALNQARPHRDGRLHSATRRPIPDHSYETHGMTRNFSAKNGEGMNKGSIRYPLSLITLRRRKSRCAERYDGSALGDFSFLLTYTSIER